MVVMKLCTDCKHRMGITCYRPHYITGIYLALPCDDERTNAPHRCGIDAEYWKPTLLYRIKKMMGVVK